TTRAIEVVPGAPICPLPPQITSSLTGSTLLNQPFTYVMTASSTAQVTFNVATTSLPTGITFDGDHTISGTPTQVGTFTINITASNLCGSTTQPITQTFTLIVNNNP